MATSEKKLLNPKAVEFRPCSVNNPPFFPISPAESPVFHHLPQIAPTLPPPPPPPPQPELVNLYPPLPPQPQPQPMMYYYPHNNNQINQFNHYHFYPPPTFMSTHNYFFPRPDLFLPNTDEGLGLITSPTSPTSPFEFLSNNSNHPKFSHKRSTRKSNLGRVKRQTPETGNCSASSSSGIKIWVRKSETPVEADPNAPLPLAAYPFRDCTSLMIRNIPVRLRRTELMRLLDEHCFQENAKLGSDAEPRSMFDYLYLPIDFKRRGNLGYAFVNFTSWQGASRLYNSWKGTTWDKCSYRTKKICQIYPAKFQGMELKKHLERSMYPCESDEYLPVEINPPRDGSNAEATKVTTLGTRVVLQTLSLGLGL